MEMHITTRHPYFPLPKATALAEDILFKQKIIITNGFISNL